VEGFAAAAGEAEGGLLVEAEDAWVFFLNFLLDLRHFADFSDDS